ncbi:MAG: hypothetical protein KBD94_04730 [Pyrinomonadaceae bacterium]|nr:hypothetical protein [Pyrinomonadaceae bacterium]
MRFSRIGIIALLAVSVLAGANCGYYNRVMARKDLVDGSAAYKNRKFDEAQALFKKAIGRDPKGDYLEGRMAQLFLARTLHSQYIGNRKETAKAEQAIVEYQKALAFDPKDQASYKAVASLYENLQKPDEWLDWVTKRSQNASIPPEQRAEAFTSLAAKKNGCATDISDTEATKKKTTKDGKPAYTYVKPVSTEEFEKFKQCIADGTQLIDQAIALEPDTVKNAASINIKSLSDAELKAKQDLLKVFESARSYKTSLLYQSAFLAEMEGRGEDYTRLKGEADDYRKKFLELSDIGKNIQTEIDERAAAKEAEGPGGKAKANANAASNK